jgi:gliding motility-associated-like protein
MRDYPLSDTRYEVTISDGISPPQTLSAQITVLETRKVALALERYNNMDEIFEGEEVLVTATSGFESYRLLLNNEVIQASGLNNGVSFHAELGRFIVRVFATDFNGCVTQDQMDIFVDSRKLPNVFTPNFDGKNDLFLEGFDLEVYSRAGELLYKGVNGWDGTYKGKMMQQGTYLYTVRRIMNNGELRIIKSTVTIKL